MLLDPIEGWARMADGTVGEITVGWAADTPAEIRALVEPILRDWLWLVPRWCQKIHVRSDSVRSDDATVVADCHTSVEYRWARITIYAPWLRQSPADRQRDLIHELLHIALQPMSDVMATALDATENEQLAAYVRADWTRAMESAVQDLTYAISGARGP